MGEQEGLVNCPKARPNAALATPEGIQVLNAKDKNKNDLLGLRYSGFHVVKHIHSNLKTAAHLLTK